VSFEFDLSSVQSRRWLDGARFTDFHCDGRLNPANPMRWAPRSHIRMVTPVTTDSASRLR
jgi:hypothetical protein